MARCAASAIRSTGAQESVIIVPDSRLVLEKQRSLDARALRKFGRPDLLPPGFDARLFRYTSPPGQSYNAATRVGSMCSHRNSGKTRITMGKDFAGSKLCSLARLRKFFTTFITFRSSIR